MSSMTLECPDHAILCYNMDMAIVRNTKKWKELWSEFSAREDKEGISLAKWCKEKKLSVRSATRNFSTLRQLKRDGGVPEVIKPPIVLNIEENELDILRRATGTVLRNFDHDVHNGLEGIKDLYLAATTLSIIIKNTMTVFNIEIDGKGDGVESEASKNLRQLANILQNKVEDTNDTPAV